MTALATPPQHPRASTDRNPAPARARATALSAVLSAAPSTAPSAALTTARGTAQPLSAAPASARRSPRAPDRGSSLIEALLGAALLAFAMLGALHWQARARAEAHLARDRGEATQLARQALEQQRAFIALEPGLGEPTGGAPSTLPTYADIAAGEHAVESRTATFTVQREVGLVDGARLKAATAHVDWQDAAGQARRVSLSTLIEGSLPGHGAALTWAASAPAVARPQGRHATIPADARDLGNGRSLWQPAAPGPGSGGPDALAPTSPIAALIDNSTGDVIGLCEPLPANRVAPADPPTCHPFEGTWLAGHVRFSQASPPTPRRANDPPKDYAVYLVDDEDNGASSAPAPAPGTGGVPLPFPAGPRHAAARGQDARRPAAGPRSAPGQGPAPSSSSSSSPSPSPTTAPASAPTSTPPSHPAQPAEPSGPPEPPAGQPLRCGISPVQEEGPQGERFSRYACIVALPASGEGWSGRPVLHPIGWRVGATAKHHRICRYTPGIDRGQATDSASPPPERHVNVTAPLLQQNFLVVRGDQACPDGTFPAGALPAPTPP